MAIVMLQEQPEMFNTDIYDAVNAKLGNVEANPPAGLIAHTLGRGEDGIWRVVDVWESQEALDRFSEDRLMPAIMETLREQGMDTENMPQPKRLVYETYDVFPREAVAH